MTTRGIDEGLGVLLRPAHEADTQRWLEMLADADHRRHDVCLHGATAPPPLPA